MYEIRSQRKPALTEDVKFLTDELIPSRHLNQAPRRAMPKVNTSGILNFAHNLIILCIIHSFRYGHIDRPSRNQRAHLGRTLISNYDLAVYTVVRINIFVFHINNHYLNECTICMIQLSILKILQSEDIIVILTHPIFRHLGITNTYHI